LRFWRSVTPPRANKRFAQANPSTIPHRQSRSPRASNFGEEAAVLYRARQHELRWSNANLVEIDPLRAATVIRRAAGVDQRDIGEPTMSDAVTQATPRTTF
jgi:hypothetical protein